VEYKRVADMIEPPYDPAEQGGDDRFAPPPRREPPAVQTGRRGARNQTQQAQTLTGENLFLVEQVTIEVKMCTQSIVWGIRGSFLTGKPSDNAIRSSLSADAAAAKRLDALLANIVELTTFLDEGEKTNRTSQPPPSNASKMFRFTMPELRESLAKYSVSLAKM
jgi:hypothetical protein